MYMLKSSNKAHLAHCLVFSLLGCLLLSQVLGLTNYSSWPKAGEMRACMLEHKDIAGDRLLHHTAFASTNERQLLLLACHNLQVATDCAQSWCFCH